ncbi:MAG: DNA polymerase IV [Rhodospirillales bacterium]|jgi:DNA polymerase IV|nr:DNA polymerase IV [Rhodospirillales bacterium]
MDALCRDCANLFQGETKDPHLRCPKCRSTRIIAHSELTRLTIAHIDCDAFYAAVEKRDNPEIRGKPVIVGGGDRRGVVAAACYVARISGVRSAMPIFQARKLCPDAVIISPDGKKYSEVGKQVRTLMETLSPLVEPLSIDEAFLDLSGTRGLHGTSPAETLVKLVHRIENEIGINASVGLSFNKFLAKIASDLDKPRGFAIIGEAEAEDFLADRPVGMIWGVGKSLKAKLESSGIQKIGDLRRFSQTDLVARYGSIGERLFKFCRARDERNVDPTSLTKSISAETTFNDDISNAQQLADALWTLTVKVSDRLKKADLGCGGITLKLKTANFKGITRSRQLPSPTQLSTDIYTSAESLLFKELSDKSKGVAFRLIGIGATRLVDSGEADLPDLADPGRGKRVKVEAAMDNLRNRFGKDTIKKGRGLS